MCTKSESIVSGLQSIIAESEATKKNASAVAKWLRSEVQRMDAEIEALQERRDEYVRKARMLDGGEVITLKEGEKLSKQKTTKTTKTSKPAKPAKHKYHKPTQAEIDAMTPERRARYDANVARCEKMRMAKALKALQEKASETKIS